MSKIKIEQKIHWVEVNEFVIETSHWRKYVTIFMLLAQASACARS